MYFTKPELSKLYLKSKKSSFEIAKFFDCSENRINYWLSKYNIKKRSISEAVYNKHNPNGDPFRIVNPNTIKGNKLLGLGLGLYWGEGTKSNKTSIRLGNTDPRLISKFIEFLVKICSIDKKKLKFGLQVFSDISASSALGFWSKSLNVPKSSFQKVIITPSRGIGTYKFKNKYGVLTVQYHNKKLRDIICNMVGDL
jgi:hypothetical protein